MSERTGFFEESPGVRSMTRLTMFMLTLYVGIAVTAISYYLTHGTPSAGVITAFGTSVLGVIIIHGIAATHLRNSGDAPGPAAPPTDGAA